MSLQEAFPSLPNLSNIAVIILFPLRLGFIFLYSSSHLITGHYFIYYLFRVESKQHNVRALVPCTLLSSLIQCLMHR